jgi:hypothetical protein
MYGPVVEQGMQRIRSDQKSRELRKYLDIVAKLREERLEWIKHLVIMDHGRVVKKTFKSKLGVGKRRGRLELKLLEDVENDLRGMEVKRWRHKSNGQRKMGVCN